MSTAGAVAAAIQNIELQLGERGLSLANVCKLLIHYLPRPGLDRRSLPGLVAQQLPDTSSVALTMQPVCTLFPEHSTVSILAVAVADNTGNVYKKDCMRPPDSRYSDPFHEGVACAGFVFVSGQLASGESLVAQNAEVLRRIASVLNGFDLTPRNLIKFNTWRAPPPSQHDYQVAASARFEFLQDVACAVTGITVPHLDATSALIHIDAWAVKRRSGVALDPDNHWDWPAPNPYVQGVLLDDWVFVGGQASLDEQGQVVHPDDFAAQQSRTIDYVHRVLNSAGEDFELKYTNSYHCPGKIGTDQTSFAPVSTWGGVAHLAYPGQLIEIEGIARRR